MRFDRVSVLSVATVDAPHRVTSVALEDRLAPMMRRLGMPRGMIGSLTGITARRVFDPQTQPSDAAHQAAARAISEAGVDPSRLGVLVSTSVCRDYIEPSTACIVHGKLGLAGHCMNFDVGNACLGFINGMEIVGNMIERGQIDYGVVVDGENSHAVLESTISRLLQPDVTTADFTANFATLTLGSGGAAMVLGRSDLAPDGHPFLGTVNMAATEHRDLCRGQVDHMHTDPKGLLVAGVELAGRTFARAAETLGWSPDVLDELVLHQVSRTHTEQLVSALNLDMRKVLALYPEYGNVGPAAVPTVLAKAVEMGRVKSGSRVALMGIGSGLNCAMAEVRW